MPSLVQASSKAVASQSGLTCTVTFASATTAGNCLVLGFSYFDPNNGGTVSSVKLGTLADNWALKVTSTGGSSQNWPGLIDWYTDPDCAGGQTQVIITVSNLTAYPYEGINAWAAEWSGLTGAADVSHTGYNYGGSGLNWSSGTTGTTSQAVEVWAGMGVTWQNGGSNPITGPSSGGWTNTYISASSQYAAVAGYQVTSATGTATYAGTMTTPGQSSNAAVICLLAVTSPAPAAVTGKAVIGSPVISTGALTLTPAAVTGKASVGSPVISVPAQPAEHILVPAYSYPASGSSSPYWEAMYSAVPALLYLVVDVNSGNLGGSADTDYQSAVTAALATPGLVVVGYVDTEHASTPISTIETNIGLYYTYYGITSIFFDNASTGTGDISYYTTLANYVHNTAGAVTVFNHGVTPNQAYAAIADVMIVFEGPSYPDGTGIGDWQSALAGTIPDIPQLPASWFPEYTPGRFCAIVYETTPSAGLDGGTPEAWQTVLGQAQTAGIGVVYLTDATYASNPYDVLPSYWTSEVAAVDATAAGGIAPGVVTGKAVFTAPSLSAGLTATAVAAHVIAAVPGVSGAAAGTPSAVHATTAVGTPGVAGAAAVTPPAVTGTTSLASPVITLPGTALPATVTGTTVISGAPVNVAAITPSAVTGTAAVPAPGFASAAAVTPAAVPATTAVSAPGVTVIAAVTPAVVSAATAVSGTAHASADGITPAVVPGTTTVPGPVLAAGTAPSPAAVAGTAIVPAGTPSITAGAATAAPAVVSATTAVSATPSASALLAPATVTAAAAVISGTPAVSADGITPAAVTGTVTVPGPGLTGVAALSPPAVTGTTRVPAASPAGGATVTYAAWFAPTFITGPGIGAGLTAAGVPATTAVGAPGIGTGLTTTAVTGTTLVPAVNVSAGTTVTLIPAVTVGATAILSLPALLVPGLVTSEPEAGVTATVPLTVRITPAVPLHAVITARGLRA